MKATLNNIYAADQYLINNRFPLIFNISIFIANIPTTLPTYRKGESNSENILVAYQYWINTKSSYLDFIIIIISKFIGIIPPNVVAI